MVMLKCCAFDVLFHFAIGFWCELRLTQSLGELIIMHGRLLAHLTGRRVYTWLFVLHKVTFLLTTIDMSAWDSDIEHCHHSLRRDVPTTYGCRKMEFWYHTPGLPIPKHSLVPSNESPQHVNSLTSKAPLNILGFWKLTKSCIFYWK
jgi:hypothetical protein